MASLEEVRKRLAVLKAASPGPCELCGAYEALRPYGANGENICFDCGKQNEAMTERRMEQHLLGTGFDA